MPTAGIDYPGSYAEFVAWFPDEAACRDYLEWLRWPEGFRCSRCPSRDGWQLDRGRWECSLCGHQATVTANTIFGKTRTPLRLWFEAAWLMTSQKHGVSALYAAGAGAGLLPDRVGDAAPLPGGDGASGP